jgi:hypothetical protein
MDGEIHGKGQQAATNPPVVPLTTGGTTNLTFAQKVAQASKDLNNLTNTVKNVQDQRETESSNTPAQLTDQLNQNTGLLNEANSVASLISSMQSDPDADANKSEIDQLKSTLNTLTSEITTLTKGTAEALSAYMDVQNSTTSGKNNYNIPSSNLFSPQPTAPDTTTNADPPTQSDGPNLFLATGMMAIMMKIELGLVKQTELNMDAERQVKQKDFENVRGMATAVAESAYSKDMADANSTLASAIGSFVSAGIGLVAGLGSMIHAGSMKEGLQEQKDEMVDNPKFLNAFKKQYGEDWSPEHPQAGKPVVDKTTGTINSPGTKQMQERLDQIKSQSGSSASDVEDAEDATPRAGQTTVTTQRANAKAAEIKDLETDLTAKQKEHENFNVDFQYTQKMQSDPKYQMWQSLKNLGETLPQAVAGIIQSSYKMQEAQYDRNQIMAQMAQDMANKGLSSAMDAFSGELKNAQTILETIMQSQSKNTQWRNISA